MKLIASSILNLLFHPIGFLLLKDSRLFLLFLILPITPLIYIIVFFLSYFDNPWIIILFFIVISIILKSVVIFFTIKSYRSINNRKSFTKYGTYTNIFLIFLIFISYITAEDFCIKILKEKLISANNIINLSTEPSIQKGDYVFVKRKFLNIERGDFITFKQRHIFEEKPVEMIKRVIGLPGDKIKIVKLISKNNYETYKIILNGNLVENEESNDFVNQDLFDFHLKDKHFYKEKLGNRYYHTMYSNSLPDSRIFTYLNKEIILANDQYFVLGDNRGDAFDSLTFGPIQLKDITGELFFVYFSVNFRDFTCNPSTMLPDYNYPTAKACPTDWYTHLIRSTIRFKNIGNRGFFNI
ncbi:signal peptidase I [Leptospira sp. 96542]|nr:signal peptidase I [Leptospira sp. 96542]